MDSLPIQYLHLETGITPIFLAMILLIQLARTREPGHYTQSSRRQMFWLFTAFALLSVVFGVFLARVSPLLAVELAAGFTLSLLHPVNALCFFVHMLYLRPWEIVQDNLLLQALPRLLGVLCFFSWLLHPEHHGKPTAQTLSALKLLLAFSFWLFLATFVTPNIAETQADWFGTYFKALVIFVMCLFFIDNERSIAEFEMTLVIGALALMVVGCYQFFTEGTTSMRLETVGMFGNSNDLAAIIVMALPFALMPMFSNGTRLSRKTIGFLFSGFSLLMIWYTRSRGAMLAFGVQILTVVYLKTNGKKRFRMLLLAGLLGAGYFAVLKAIPRESEDMQVSSDSRITFWKAAVNMTLHHPVFGVGFEQYPVNYDSYSSGVKYSWGLRTAHSSWFLAFAESGVLGGLLFAAFFLMVLKTAWRNRHRWPAQLYALAGYGICMSFLSHTYTLYFYLLAGLIMASDSLKEESESDHETT